MIIMNSAHGYSEGAEVPGDKTLTNKKRIEKDADKVASKWLEVQYTAAKDSYITGATLERDKAIDEALEILRRYKGAFLISSPYNSLKQELESLKNKPI